MNAPAIQLDQVSFRYPGTETILDRVDLAVEEGEIVGIVGPSGCGKSTLLYLIAELLAPTTGAVRTNVDATRSNGSATTMVFQKETLLPWLTVLENALLYTRFHSARGRLWRPKPTEEQVNHATGLLELVGLADRGDAYPYQLSGGMRRRLQFLASVAASPQILLLDEPFSSVDEPTRISIHQDAHDVVRRIGITTILVTHDLAEALTLCDRVIILSRRPASVAEEVRVGFGTKREMLTLRGSDEYLKSYGQLWNGLARQIQGTPAATPAAS